MHGEKKERKDGKCKLGGEERKKLLLNLLQYFKGDIVMIRPNSHLPILICMPIR